LELGETDVYAVKPGDYKQEDQKRNDSRRNLGINGVKEQGTMDGLAHDNEKRN
jgi:hypothetical protein